MISFQYTNRILFTWEELWEWDFKIIENGLQKLDVK